MVDLISCNNCGKGIWQGDPFFKCSSGEDCCEWDDDSQPVYCKDCVKRCEECHKFICEDCMEEHKESHNEEED